MSTRPPSVPGAIGAAALVLLTVGERTPEFSDQSTPALQAPLRRHDDQEEAHREAETEQHRLPQEALEHLFFGITVDDSEWWDPALLDSMLPLKASRPVHQPLTLGGGDPS